MVFGIVTQINAQEYKMYKELPELTIDYRTENCGAEPNLISEFHFIRLTNKTAEAITVSFKIEPYINGNCTTCHNDEYYFTFEIPANSSITSYCDQLQEKNGNLALVSKYLNRDFGSDLDKFEITNISIR